MRICYIGDADNIHMQKWVNWFANKGHDVHLITDRPAEINGVKIYAIGNKKRNSFSNFIKKILQTRKLVKKIEPDVLHAHYAFGYGTFGAFANYHPFVLSPWGSDILIEPEKSKMKKFLVKFALKKADLITCDGDNTIEKMIHFGTDPKKIHRIYHGVDPVQFSPTKIDEKLKGRLGVSDSPLIISTRNLDLIYGIETLIESVPLVLKKIPNAKFIVAGEIVYDKTVEKDYLKKLAKSLGVINSIKFVGPIPHDELPYYLTSSDVYVSTSLSDGGIAMSTLEAMACELAPIVTDVADNKKWIKNGENGFVIPLKDPNALAEKIIYLLQDEGVRKNFGKICREMVKEKQNYEKEMKKVEKLCMDLINQ
jgi:glycosyltransferase involved in cell wall biosynthesis